MKAASARSIGPSRAQRQPGAESSPQTGESPSKSPQPAPKDHKLEQWEAGLCRKGQATMRYKAFRSTVSVNPATGALQGRMMSRAGWWIGGVEAAEASEFRKGIQGRSGRSPRSRQPLSKRSFQGRRNRDVRDDSLAATR